MSISDTKTPTKTTIDNTCNKKPLGNVQEENLQQETEKKHSLDHSSNSCTTEDTEPPSIKLKKVVKKKKLSTSNSIEEKEKWTDSRNPPEIDNR